MKLLVTLVLSGLILFGAGGCSAATDSRVSEAGTPRVALCSADGAFETGEAQRVRDELSQRRPLSARRLKQIVKALNRAAPCIANLAPPNAEMVGTLYVLLGDQYLARKYYSDASGSFERADSYYSRLGFPSLMWLEALRGEARAKFRMGELRSADRAASRQTDLARSWVQRNGFVKDALVDSLRFEAQVSDAEGKSKQSNALKAEADRVESGSTQR